MKRCRWLIPDTTRHFFSFSQEALKKEFEAEYAANEAIAKKEGFASLEAKAKSLNAKAAAAAAAAKAAVTKEEPK